MFSKKEKQPNSALKIFLTIITALMFSLILIPTISAERSNGGADIFEDSHIIQIYQVDDPQDVLLVYETIVMNNTSDSSYSGTILFEIETPMYINVRINNTELVDAVKVTDNLYSIQLPENYTIEPNNGVGFTLEYAVIIPPESIDNFNFKKTFQYRSNLVMLVIYPIDGYEAKGIGIELTEATTESFAGAYISPHFTPVTVAPGESYTVVFSEVVGQPSSDTTTDTKDSSSNLLIAVLVLVLIVAVIIINVYLRKGKSGRESKKTSSPKGSDKSVVTMTAAARKKTPAAKKKTGKAVKAGKAKEGSVSIEKERKKLIQDKKNVLIVRRKLKNDLKSNKITKEKFAEKDKKYQVRLKEINKIILKLDKKHEQGEEYLDKESASALSAGGSVAALEERKKTLLSVLKHLESDYEEGNITEDLYDDLKSDYKQEALDILKKLDGMKKAN